MPEPSLKQVEEVFHRAVALESSERAAYLDAACSEDPELRSAVETLLQYDRGSHPTDAFLTSPVAAWRGSKAATVLGAQAPPRGPALPNIPGYELLKELGRGGMGVVYQALQVSLKRVVALKMLLAAGPATEKALARFRSEAETLARLHDPHIVLVYDVGEFEGQPYFTMEYVAGPSLDRRLASRAQDPFASARMMETIARAVHAVHEAGIIHRDLKPANVLLEAPAGQPDEMTNSARRQRPLIEYQPKITDFGLAKDFASERKLTQTGTAMGTPCYMAPEQASGEGEVGAAADVYSLGAILYEMLTGRPPFEGDTALATISQLLHDEPLSPLRLRPGLPRDLVTVCLKCLEKQPHRRYRSALDVAEDLRRFQHGEPIRARPVTVIERAYRWCRRRPLVASLLALSTILAVAFVVTVIVYEIRLQGALQLAEARAEQEQRQIVQLNVNIGTINLERGDSLAALLCFLEALPLEDDPKAARKDRIRIGTILRQHPRLRELFRLEGGLAPVIGGVDPSRAGDAQAASGLRPEGIKLSDGSVVRARRTSTGSLSAPVPGRLLIEEAVFNPDGSRVVARDDKSRARVWDTRTGQPLSAFMRHRGGPSLAAFSEDGSLLATSDGETVRLWDGETGQLLAPPVEPAGALKSILFSPQGDHVLLVHRDGKGAAWDISPDERPLEHLIGLAKFLSGRDLDEAERPLSSDEIRSAREKMEAQGKKR
jgi:serine/threonine protein kinase